MTNQNQDADARVRDEELEPNDYGFSGGATAPEVSRRRSRDPVAQAAEEIAIPGDDLMAALMGQDVRGISVVKETANSAKASAHRAS